MESVQELILGAVVALTPCLVILGWLLLCSPPAEEPAPDISPDQQIEGADEVSQGTRFAA